MRVVIADDSVVIRSGLSSLLPTVGIDVVAAVADAPALMAAAVADAPDAVIVDIKMPPTFTDEGLVAAARIRVEHPRISVLVLSQYLASSYAARLLEQTPSGVGYLLKDRVSDAEALAAALRRVVDGDTVVDRAIIDHLMSRTSRRAVIARLTERERDVLALMAEGLSNQAIAVRLGLSPKTLETHIGRVFDKLGLLQDPEAHRRVLAVLTYLRGGSR